MLSVPSAWLLAAALTTGGPCPGVTEGWGTAGGDSFHLFDQRGMRTAVEAARALAEFEHLARRTLGVDGPARRVRVFVFADEEAFRFYAASAGGAAPDILGGFFASAPGGGWLAVHAGDAVDWRRTLRHELVHALLGERYPAAPAWAREGIAEYLSTLVVEDGAIVAGRPVRSHLERLRRERWLSPDELHAVRSDRELRSLGHDVETFYAQSWLLVHRILHDPAAAWNPRRILTAEPSSPPADLRLYARRVELPVARFGEPALTAASVTRKPTDRSRIAVRLGELLLLAHDRREEAAAHFELALALDGERPGARSGLAMIDQLAGLDRRAARGFRAARRIGRHDERFLFWQGEMLLARYETELDRDEAEGARLDPLVLRARRAFARCLELAPERTDALAAYGATFLYDPGNPARGLRALERAVTRVPHEIAYRANFAVLLAEAGRHREAAGQVAELVRRGGDHPIVQRTERFVRRAAP